MAALYTPDTLRAILKALGSAGKDRAAEYHQALADVAIACGLMDDSTSRHLGLPVDVEYAPLWKERER